MFLEPQKIVQVDTSNFYVVPESMHFIKKVGAGAYGSVCAFLDALSNNNVAVKRIANTFRDLTDAKRILREIKILRHVQHKNIIW